MAKKKKVEQGTIQLTRLTDAIIEVPIKGITPLIPHNWSEKARRTMPGHPDAPDEKVPKGKRQPEIEADGCLYYIDDERLGMPATAFKAALVGACRFFEKPSMVEAKVLLFVEGEGPKQLVPIEYKTKELHEDMPRNANGGTDLRYRYYLVEWTATLRIRYVPALISRESILALADAAGRGGVGDWRASAPKSHTGTYGTWRIDDRKKVKDVI